MKKRLYKLLLWALMGALILCPISARAGIFGARESRVSIRGGGQDTVTLMVYLCGSDLESQAACASVDLEEMMAASLGENINLIVETGGANRWYYDFISPGNNQRWQIAGGKMHLLETLPMEDMADPRTLADFIAFGRENFPADRYMLVLWDHGGGTVGGYAYDERFGGDTMSIGQVSQALAAGGVVFDMIGFDCCLMATAETAYMVEKYADYMVASQRVEPGSGWHYTPWLNALGQNSSLPTDELGRIIVDSFLEESGDGEVTLSVIDLAHIPALFDSLCAFFEKAQYSLISDRAFLSAARTLQESRAISDNEDMADLGALLGSMAGSEEALCALQKCVIYNGATLSDHGGLSLYFPYQDVSRVDQALAIYDQIGLDEAYQDFITTFAHVMLGGQDYSGGGSGSPLGDQAPNWLAAGWDWVNASLFAGWDDFYQQNDCDTSQLFIWQKGEDYVLSLPDEEWKLITQVEQRVLLDDGEGYIDLGADTMYEFDEEGDLLIAFDNTWVALDGQLVCYYAMEEWQAGDSWRTWGVTPVQYAGRDAQLVLVWDDEHPQGYCPGWRYSDVGGASPKGLFPFLSGMTFDFVCDYYSYDEEFVDSYLWGDITVTGPIEVSYEDVGAGDCLVYYQLWDVYHNDYWTEPLIYSLAG